jgi:3-deoxy-7-phosphoheptulonate synthase
LIDCGHANSGKDLSRSTGRAAQIAAGERALVAVMLESNLIGGAQDYLARPLIYGRSITDACLDWDETRPS